MPYKKLHTFWKVGRIDFLILPADYGDNGDFEDK